MATAKIEVSGAPFTSDVASLLSRSNLRKDALAGEVALVTGAGRGIGFEASKALLILGSNVVVAEIDSANCNRATTTLQHEFGETRVTGVQADVGDEDGVARIAKAAAERFGHVDIVLNNATSLGIGAVKDARIDAWDGGYHVILRGAVLMARTFLPGMLARKHGVFVCVSSSGAAPYMGPYEVFKTAQVELANTIAGEVEGKGVFAFTIGPGIVRTPGFLEGGSKVAALMGVSMEELVEMNKSALLTVEEAGVGFAGSIAMAERYHGSETSSIQVLRDMGIVSATEETKTPPGGSPRSLELLAEVAATYVAQSRGWKERNIFERQWVLRDFKKHTGMSVDEMGAELSSIASSMKGGELPKESVDALKKLSAYYQHQQELLRGFEKNPTKLEENLREIQTWIDTIQGLTATLG
jgi:NAD(P)-dependent dehydrogenase (short-subunit alcohol dehydrogenase family)